MNQQRTEEEAIELAKKVMFDKGLLDPMLWKFELSNRFKRRIGDCNRLTNVIRVGSRFARYATTYHFEQVVLHEIAHALTDCGHTRKFKQVCKEIGCETDSWGVVFDICYVYNGKKYWERTKEDLR